MGIVQNGSNGLFRAIGEKDTQIGQINCLQFLTIYSESAGDEVFVAQRSVIAHPKAPPESAGLCIL